MDSAGDLVVKPGSVVIGHLHSAQSIAGTFATSLDKLYQSEDRVLFPPIRNLSNIHVHTGRNEVVRAFLERTPGEWLLFLDDDMGFPADIVAKLLEAADPVERPVMGGLCFAQKRYEVGPELGHRYKVVPTIYRFVMTATTAGFGACDDYNRNAVVKVDGTGAACLMIHRSVLQRMRDEVGDRWFDPVTISIADGQDSVTFSEDLSFCWRCAAAEIPVHVNTAAKTSHLKEVYLDEWYFDHQPVRTVEPATMIVGAPRSGLAFLAAALADCGVNAGHEQWWNPHGIRAPGAQADASWMGIAALEEYEGRVWFLARHPLRVLRSLMEWPPLAQTGEPWAAPYRAILQSAAGFDDDDPLVVQALRVLVWAWELAAVRADRIVRVEDLTPGTLVELADAFGRDVPLSYCRGVVDRLGAGRVDRPGLRWSDLPHGNDVARAEKLARHIGYEALEVD